MSEDKPTIRTYVHDIGQLADAIDYEYEFRKKHGGYGIASAWSITAETMTKYTPKIRFMLAKIIDLLDGVVDITEEEAEEGTGRID